MANLRNQTSRKQYMAYAAMARRRNVSVEEMARRFREKKINNSMKLEFLQEIYRAAERLEALPPEPMPIDEMKIKRWLVLGVFVLSFLLASMLGFYVG